MAKRYIVFPFLVIALLIVVAGFSATAANSGLIVSAHGSGVVNKGRSDAFQVLITFKNTGSGDGTWSVAAVFEGDSWVWKGQPQTLTLTSGDTKTLEWDGNVPKNAAINSVARLVVYFGDSFTVFDWWIHVTSGLENSQLSISSSSVG
jgi:hypothetical protein